MTTRRKTANYKLGGGPCKYGHNGPRYKNGNCVDCLLIRERAKQADPMFAEAKRIRSNAQYSENLDIARSKLRERRAANPDLYKEYAKNSYERHKDKRLAENRAYRIRNLDAILKRDREYGARNREQRIKNNKLWRIKNPPDKEKASLYSKEHFKKNKHRYAARNAARRRIARNAKPKWANDDRIELIYKKAAELTEQTGVEMSVDHIIPLKASIRGIGQVACGLHVESNLRIITLDLNKRLNAYGWHDEFGHLPYNKWPKGYFDDNNIG